MKKIFCLLLLATLSTVKAGEEGTTFFIVGDYGVVTNLTQADQIFDAIDTVVGAAQPQTIGDPEFFITVGDNIYPAVEGQPTVEEFQLMLGLFNRTNIKDIPVWAVRGNHDAAFNWTYELQITMEQS